MRMATAVLIGLTFQGCYYDSEEALYPDSFCDVSSVTWTSTIEPLIASQCAIPGCHVPGGDGVGDFTSYAGVKAKVDNGSFQTQVIEQRSMPPPGGLPTCELQQVAIWVQDGAPEN